MARVITSRDNSRLKLVRKLRSKAQRTKLGLFVCEGEDLVEAALAAGIVPAEVLVDAERPVLRERSPEPEYVAPALLAEVSALAHPPRVIAVFRHADLPRLEHSFAPPVGLALWRVADPGNVGTLLRTADALGPAFVALSHGCAEPTGPKALRASMGAVFRVPVGRFDDAPRPRVALVPSGGEPLAELELRGHVTFVLGSEREGLPEEVAGGCERRASIPLAAGSESLNVAVAGAIALFEWRRRAGFA